MCRSRKSRSSVRPGFTLIELLVVVAIIALLISILLPSLSKARAQARATLCLSRISQLTKSVLIYAEDFDGRPCFVGTGDEPGDCSDSSDEDKAAVDAENWLTRNQWIIANTWEDDWPGQIEAAGDVWQAEYVPRTGTLFEYTRFARLYLCPEFERVTSPEKSQSVFNYSRSILARKWWVPELDGDDVPPDLAARAKLLGVMGDLLSLSSIFMPGKLELMIDEHWRYNIADADGAFPRMGGAWMRSEPVWYGPQSEIGRYHGQPVNGWIAPFPSENDPDLPTAGEIEGRVKRGSVSFYDGHAALERDFMPGHNIAPAMFDERAEPVKEWIRSHRFFQRGRDSGDF